MTANIVDTIMEQAQVFASTYSLVGGRFDDGNMMQQSELEKAELRRVIQEALAPACHSQKVGIELTPAMISAYCETMNAHGIEKFVNARIIWDAMMAVASPQSQTLVTLADCPIGLFRCGGELCLKTEYGSNEGRIDAYIVSSGEFFWGGTSKVSEQRKVMVEPVAEVAVSPAPDTRERG